MGARVGGVTRGGDGRRSCCFQGRLWPAANARPAPGSGTGELRGLRGDGGFKAELGQHGTIWLDYDFEAKVAL
jgi:hypothetical protein